MNVRDLRFLKYITYRHAKTILHEIDFDKNYPQFLNEEVPIFISSKDLEYAQLFDWHDEDQFAIMPKNY